VREWQALESAQGTLYIAARVATMLFPGLIAVMTIARRRPVRQADGWLPRFAGLAGFLLIYALLLLPRTEPIRHGTARRSACCLPAISFARWPSCSWDARFPSCPRRARW